MEAAHNTYLQMGAELGYAGLGIFLVMVVVSFVTNARSARLAKREGFEFLRAFALAMNAAGAGLVLGERVPYGFLSAELLDSLRAV